MGSLGKFGTPQPVHKPGWQGTRAQGLAVANFSECNAVNVACGLAQRAIIADGYHMGLKDQQSDQEAAMNQNMVYVEVDVSDQSECPPPRRIQSK